MISSITQWFQRRFVGTELGNLALIIIAIVLLIWGLGKLIVPVFVSVVLAYLLDGMIRQLQRWRVPHNLAVNFVFLLFLGLVVFGLFILLPLVWDQLASLLNELPTKVKQVEIFFTDLSQRYPAYLSKAQIQSVINGFQSDFARIGKYALSISLTTISSVMMIVVYLVLVPLIVYFFLKDRDPILNWFARFLPQKRQLSRQVWGEVNQQIGAYIQAKILEMIIVGVASTLVFVILGLNYAVLLGVLVGLSALIPYVGVILVTVPLVIVAYVQWGFDVHFLYLMIAYCILMVLDGNVLTPLLFSETMKIHPVAVIIAVLIFGGLWGFWGIFFAIPLAAVVKVLLNAWVQHNDQVRRETPLQ